MEILTLFLYFVSGIFLNMSLNHLVNFAETRRHPMIARTGSPKLASSIWGVVQLFAGGLILLLLGYKVEPSAYTLCLFLGFSAWAIFLGAIGDRADRRMNK